MQQVKVVTIKYNGDLEVDIYYPPDHDFKELLPAVLIVSITSDRIYESGFIRRPAVVMLFEI